MTLPAGTRLGPYEVLSPLGAGGMGEVYRARDTQLDRDVAIKALPQAFLGDLERLARFEREAKMLAALNHPAIASIYGLAESGTERLLVLEFVPGETLAERLASGPLPIDEALAMSRQIAEALEAAHEKGIVHRDLKPANVKVTPAGKVKVLDFGLAKAFDGEASAGGDLSRSPTITAGATQQGVILGTAPYMSPEQARGKVVDRRTDIWAFGCLMYELLTGRRAFEGETVSDVIVSVLSREPDWSALPPATPERVTNLVRRCLRKDPARRLHDIADARLDLEDASGELEAGVVQPAKALPGRPRLHPMILWPAAFLALAAALVIWWLKRPGATEELGIVDLVRITPPVGLANGPTWSPDGNLLAYASDRTGNFDIYVHRWGGSQDVNITNDPGQDVQPAFSPDGNSIAFISTRSSKTGLIRIGGVLSLATRTYGGDLWIVPSLGGGARRLAPDANYPVWRPAGNAILYVSGPESRRSILEVSVDGGAPRDILSSKDSDWEIVSIGCSPDGHWVSFEDPNERVFVLPAGGGKAKRLASGLSHAWDGRLPRLWSLAKDPKGGTRIQYFDIDPVRGEARGKPRTVGLFTTYLRELAISKDGRRFVVTEDETSRNLARLPLSPDGGSPSGPEEQLTTGREIDNYPRVSPDNRRIAFASDTLGRIQAWTLDLETRGVTHLELPGEATAETQPTWLPDGRRLVLVRMHSNDDCSGWIAALDGSISEKFYDCRGPNVPQFRPAPFGSLLLVSHIYGSPQLEVYDMASRKTTILTTVPGAKWDGEWSPDGRWVALTASDGKANQLFRMPAAGGPMQQLTSGFERMHHPFFSPNGNWIYIQPSHRNIFRVRAEGGDLEQVTKFAEAGLFIEEPTISHDGKFLVYARQVGISSLWLMSQGDRRTP
jgi:eukaryotic-like serine/threonine-protein kinase